MAVIGKIRKHSVLLLIVIGVALLAFIWGDFSKATPQRMDKVGVINGTEVTYREFSLEVDDNLAAERANQNKDNLTAEEAFRVRNSTWDQIKNEVIMGEEYNELGLVVSTDELFELVQGKNPHPYMVQYFSDPATGQFNPAMVLDYLSRLDQADEQTRRQWVRFEQAMRDDRQNTKYNNLVKKGYYVPRTLAELDYQSKNKQVKYHLTGIRYTTVADSLITYSENEIEKYYRDHSYMYIQDEEMRTIDYVVFEVTPSAEDRQEAVDYVNEIFAEFEKADDPITFVNRHSDNRYDSTWFKPGQLNARIDSTMFNAEVGTIVRPFSDGNTFYMAKLVEEAVRPDSMKASHILIAYQGALRAAPEATRTKPQAEAFADSLFQIIKANPSQLEVQAPIHSNGPTGKSSQGDLGWFADGAMIGPFNHAVETTEIGDVTLVETAFGYHIVKTTGKKDFSKKVRVAIVEITAEPSEDTYNKIYNDASRFAGENRNQDAFEQAVIDNGLNMRTAPNMRAMQNNLPGIDYPRSIIRWAFAEDTQVGQVSEVFDMEKKYVVAILKSVQPKGLRSLDEARITVEGFVRNEKKAEYLMDQFGGATGDLNSIARQIGSTVDSATTVFNSPNLKGFGRELDVIGDMFARNETGLIGPLKGRTGIYWIEIDEINEVNPPANLDLYKTQMRDAFDRRLRSNSPIRAIEKVSDIEDNRIYFY